MSLSSTVHACATRQRSLAYSSLLRTLRQQMPMPRYLPHPPTCLILESQLRAQSGRSPHNVRQSPARTPTPTKAKRLSCRCATTGTLCFVSFAASHATRIMRNDYPGAFGDVLPRRQRSRALPLLPPPLERIVRMMVMRVHMAMATALAVRLPISRIPHTVSSFGRSQKSGASSTRSGGPVPTLSTAC